MFLIFPALLLILPLIIIFFFHRPKSESLSVQNIIEIVRSSFNRYPFVLLYAGLATLTTLYAIFIERWDEEMYELVTAFTFGISLSFSLYLLFKNYRYRTLLVSLSIPIVFFAYYLQKDQSFFLFSIRWIQFFLLSHLLVSFSRFLYDSSQENFWGHNKELLSSFTIATIYSGCIFVGLAIACGATQYLFEIKDGYWFKSYPSLLAVCGLFIHPCIFLGTLPLNDTGSRGYESVNLRVIRIFGSYVLIPVVLLYLAILFAYEIKIAATGTLPKGMVSWLVCSFGLAGTLTWLLTYPLGRDEFGITKIFHRRFFNLFLPLLILLCVAVYERISSYGFTELRYFLFVLTIWICVITLLFSLRPHSQIKLIPISLFLLTALTLYGPLSAYTVSYNNQRARLEQYLFSKTKCNKAAEGTISLVESKEISSIFRYLINNHTAEILTFLKDICFQNSEALTLINKHEKENRSSNEGRVHSRSILSWNFSPEFLKLLGVTSIQEYENIPQPDDRNFSFSSDLYGQKTLNISGLEELILNVYINENTGKTANLPFELTDSTLKISYKSKEAEINLLPLIEKLSENTQTKYLASSVPYEEMILEDENNGMKVKVFIQNIRGDKDKGKIIVRSLNGNVGCALSE